MNRHAAFADRITGRHRHAPGRPGLLRLARRRGPVILRRIDARRFIDARASHSLTLSRPTPLVGTAPGRRDVRRCAPAAVAVRRRLSGDRTAPGPARPAIAPVPLAGPARAPRGARPGTLVHRSGRASARPPAVTATTRPPMRRSAGPRTDLPVSAAPATIRRTVSAATSTTSTPSPADDGWGTPARPVEPPVGGPWPGHNPSAPWAGHDVERLTDLVVGAIDRRMIAHRERSGRSWP